MIFYFSATGNSKALALALAAKIDDRVADIAKLYNADDQPIVYTLSRDETIGFVFPIYGWSLPDIVRAFMARLKMKGYAGQYAYFAVTCGDDIGVSERHIRRAMSAAGIVLNAGFSVNMPDCYVCLPGFDVDADDERKGKLALFAKRANEIAKLVAGRENTFDVRRGGFAWIKTNMLGAAFRKFLVTDRFFRSTDVCTACGACVNVCPLHNITLSPLADNASVVRPQWNGNCTGCLACYHHCPVRAIRFGRFTNKKGQYLLEKHRKELA